MQGLQGGGLTWKLRVLQYQSTSQIAGNAQCQSTALLWPLGHPPRGNAPRFRGSDKNHLGLYNKA